MTEGFLVAAVTCPVRTGHTRARGARRALASDVALELPAHAEHLIAAFLKFVWNSDPIRTETRCAQLQHDRIDVPGGARSELEERKDAHFASDAAQLENGIDVKLGAHLVAIEKQKVRADG